MPSDARLPLSQISNEVYREFCPKEFRRTREETRRLGGFPSAGIGCLSSQVDIFGSVREDARVPFQFVPRHDLVCRIEPTHPTDAH